MAPQPFPAPRDWHHGGLAGDRPGAVRLPGVVHRGGTAPQGRGRADAGGAKLVKDGVAG